MKRLKSKPVGFRLNGLVGSGVFCFILSVLLVPGIAQAVPGGIPVCMDNLGRCTADLGGCSVDLKRCTVDLGGCSSNLNRCTVDLTACSSNLNRCTVDLGGCSSDLNRCSSDLKGCVNDLIHTQTDLNEALRDLAACQDALEEYKKKPPAPLPRTGQAGTLYFEAPVGSDADLQKGEAWPYPRFADNSDGTVTDKLTGLVWLKNSSCTSFFLEDRSGLNQRSWWEALRAANALASGSCGLNDGSLPGQWRLPNLRELLSLVHYGFENPALPSTNGIEKWTEDNPFTGIQLTYYWSSSSKGDARSNSTASAWFLYMANGTTGFGFKGNPASVWPVRSGK